MKNSLYKLLTKLIVQRYTWIEDCEVNFKSHKSGNKIDGIVEYEEYFVTYYRNIPNMDDKEDEAEKIVDKTYELFNVLGPNRNQRLINISFVYHENELL
jgi:hypothetical protein